MNEANKDFNKKDNQIELRIGELPFLARESFNILRGNIQMSGPEIKTIVVTSPLIHEGKSSIAVRLAYSLAALEKRTLYVDCDIRNSYFRSRYVVGKKTSNPGLTGYLCGLAGFETIVSHTQFEYLDVIMTGRTAPNPSELLSSDLFTQLLGEAKEKYDYVIIDTPPISTVIDGVLVAKQCDGTVLVLESTKSDRKLALHSKQQLTYAGAHIIGCVLNKADNSDKKYGIGYSRRYGYGQKYGYGRGYGYGKGPTKDEMLHKEAKAASRKKKAQNVLRHAFYIILPLLIIGGFVYFKLQDQDKAIAIMEKINNLAASENDNSVNKNNSNSSSIIIADETPEATEAIAEKEDAAAAETLAKETVAAAESNVKETEASTESIVKETAVSTESTVKETRASTENAAKETTASTESAVKETTASTDSTAKETTETEAANK